MAKLKSKIGLDKKGDLLKLLKDKTPGIFEREPSPAFAEGNLNKLVEEIENLYA